VLQEPIDMAAAKLVVLQIAVTHVPELFRYLR
jgi:hypothetical protein